MMKVLVTGGAGFIGYNLIKSLIKKKYIVFSLDDYSSGNKKNEIKGATYYKDDINNINNLNENFDLCFHLAAKTLVQESFKKANHYFDVNVSGTVKVLEWAKKHKVRVVYAGSASRHGDPKSSPYALSKYFGEEISELYRKNYKMNIDIARFYNVYGPNERVDEIYGNVIGIWRAKQNKDMPLPIVGDGNQTRDFIHVEDIANGLIKISQSSFNNNKEWELGSGYQYSVNELFSFFQKKYPNIEFETLDDQLGNFRNSQGLNNKMSTLLDWYPKDRLEQYIKNLN
jgi:UDP-glucose 4-epimerase